MQELNRQMMTLPELRELEEIIRFGTGPAAYTARCLARRCGRRQSAPLPSSAPTSRRRGAWPQTSSP